MKEKDLFLPAMLLFALIAAGFSGGIYQSESDPPWYSDWGVADGFAISVDTDGYSLPTAMAFVPEPGDAPNEPLYYVTELVGKIKVVSNDRTVYTFAESFFPSDPAHTVETDSDEHGMAGICLAPEQGYVFVTFSSRAEDGELHNGIMRFETQPNVFSLEPHSSLAFPDLFADFPTDFSHQIGGCQVSGDALFVSVGDGVSTHIPPIGIESPLGKVLRFTLDGQPYAANPFYTDTDSSNPANFVWSFGFRNPFGIEVVNDRVFIADNGLNLDRFLSVEPGEDYLWNGSDLSIGTRADITFAPSIAPTQIDYFSGSADMFPDEYDGSFFVGASGEVKGVVNIPYDLIGNRVVQPPSYFLRYLGPATTYYSGMVTGVAFGPDGLYFVPLMPSNMESVAVFKITYDPAHEHPYRPEDISNPVALMTTLGCLGCHSFNGRGGGQAPPLDYGELVPSLQKRLDSPEYLRSLDEVDALNEEPYASFGQARQEIREREGKFRVSTWIYYQILEPQFDDPNAQMPNLGVSEEQATIISNFLVTVPVREPEDEVVTGQTEQEDPGEGEDSSSDQSLAAFLERVRTGLPSLRYRHLPLVFLAGALAGVIAIEIYRRRSDREK